MHRIEEAKELERFVRHFDSAFIAPPDASQDVSHRIAVRPESLTYDCEASKITSDDNRRLERQLGRRG